MRVQQNFLNGSINKRMKQNRIKKGKTFSRLGSGKKINSAADDVAGLAISQKMHAQIRGLRQANRNASDTLSMLQVADGGLGETTSILQSIS